jgi:DNA-binding CsgD family transcriptional regulator
MPQRLSEQNLDELIRLVYRAAIEPESWVQVMDGLSRNLNAPAATLWTHDFNSCGVTEDQRGEVFRAAGFDPAFLGTYAEHYTYKNVWAQNEDALAEGLVVTSEMLYPDQRLGTTEFFGDWLRPQDLRHAVGAIVARSESLGVKISVLRSHRAGQFTDEECAFYRRLLPHFKQACVLNQHLTAERQALAAQISSAQWAERSSHLAMLAVTASGLLCHANPKAEAMLHAKRWMAVRQMRLGAIDPHDDAAWQAALRRVVTTRQPSHLRFRQAVGDDPCCMTVVPLEAATNVLPDVQAPMFLCLITEGSRRRIASAAQLIDLFGLTRSEARLARDLAQGFSLDEHAEAEALKRSTVKTHLQSAFGKTGTSNQRDLIRLILALPAVR